MPLLSTRPHSLEYSWGSRNLIQYLEQLLKQELGIPAEVVTYVPDFLDKYLKDVWQVTGNARPITRQMQPEHRRAREAALNLGTLQDLSVAWRHVEEQARARFAAVRKAQWFRDYVDGKASAAIAEELAGAFSGIPVRSTAEPNGSQVRLDAMWQRVRRPYQAIREPLGEREREQFDRAFASWLYWVFDPLDILAGYLKSQRRPVVERVRSGTAGKFAGRDVVNELLDDWSRRLYGSEERSWIAWILRFALPEEATPEDSFRGIPRAIPQPDHRTARRWTQIVIDEAQDLAVQEASLLASLVHSRSALTVSADFRQVVSPVHGMTDGDALKFGLPIWDKRLHAVYPFQKNLRQSREISQFIRAVYEKMFGEFPPFDAADRVEGNKALVGCRLSEELSERPQTDGGGIPARRSRTQCCCPSD